ncbi:MAG: glycosyltransferase [Candidatus Aenigmatarchaeota archaeon]|nr:glycosyltransferase [Candidatus Aenigmarchaeota archaeon]
MKIALFFDIFDELGGAERVAITLARKLNADIYTTYVNWNLFENELKGIKVNEIGLKFKNSKLLTYSEIAWRFSKLKLYGYDHYLFMRLYCISASKNNHPNTWICSSPIRSVYDLHDFIYKNLKLWQKPVFKLWCLIYKQFDKKWVKNFDNITANSQNVANRLEKYYGIKAKVTYHPVEVEKYKCKDYEDFYFAPGRFVKEKRIDLIIKAFKKMPEKKLVITGDGPEREKLHKLAKDAKNIEFKGNVSFEEIIDLYSRCTATIYMPVNEDYGLVPIESMASGKPCIAANEGGPKETIINGKTGFLIEAKEDEIIKYVNMLTPEKAREMKNECIKRAKIFSTENFIKEIKAIIEK